MGGRTFVDVGCALGHSTDILRRFCPGEWTGIDYDADTLVSAAALWPDMAFMPMPGRDSGGTWDGVVCSEVIEHVPDDRSFVADLWRIVAPGGRLAVTTPRIPVVDPGHLRLYTEAALVCLFRDVPGVKIDANRRFWFVTASRQAAPCVRTHISGAIVAGSVDERGLEPEARRSEI